MTARTLALLGATLLTAAASPTRYSPLAMSEPLVAPPRSSAIQPDLSGFLPAPMPDPDLGNAYHRDQGPAKVEVMPNLFHQRQQFWGDGYTPNSTVEGEQTKHLRPTPGLNLNVPLQ